MQFVCGSKWMKSQAVHWTKSIFIALITVLCSMAIVASGPTAAHAVETSATFEDVSAGAWYYDSVYGIAQTGLMTGYENGLFGPNDGLTRAQVATILWRYYNAGEESILCAADQVATTEVEGVRSGRWYTAAANWAVSTGVVSGKDRGNYRDFDPNGVCTRAELCTMLANAAHIMTGVETSGWDSDLDQLADGSQVPDWARSAMGWCLHMEVINGADVDGARYAAPGETATRAQMAAILMNALDAGALGERPVDDGAWAQTAEGWSYVLGGRSLTSRWISGKAIPGSGDADDTRYYLNAEGVVETASLFEAPLGGTHSYFHTTETGAIVTGVTHDEATEDVYLADADGRLPDSGWLITGAYTGGSLQRYWVDDRTHACIPGMFIVDGNLYYTRYDNGAVLRGTATLRNDVKYQADNDGHVIMPFSFQATSGSSASSVSTYMSGTSVLFLPSHTDLSEVRLEFSRLNLSDTLYVSASAEGGYFAYNSGDALDFNALGITADSQGFYRLYVKQTPDATSYQTLRIMVSRNICSTYIMSVDPDAQGRAYVEASEDHTAKASVCVLVVDADGTVLYNGDSVDDPATIKGRGNSTWEDAKKKPYQVKLSSKASLITGEKSQKSKTWLLLAEYFDQTLMRNSLALGLGASLGLTETPECRYTDLYYDGEYRGTYLICEKVEIGNGRIEITDLEDENTSTDDTDVKEHATATGHQTVGGGTYTYQYVTGIQSASDITGGYLIERDDRYKEEPCWFETSIGGFAVKSPEYASEAEVRYIQGYIQGLISLCQQPNCDITRFFDMDAMAKEFLTQVFTWNTDCYCFSSTYFFKDKDSTSIQLNCGPLWDYDTSFGWYWPWKTMSERGWGPTNEAFFFENNYFRNAVRRVYQSEFRAKVVDLIYGSGENSFSSLKAEVAATQKMDTVVWPEHRYWPAQLDNAWYDTWGEATSYMRSWMIDRLNWMDSHVMSSDWWDW